MACKGCQERREKLLAMFGYGPKRVADVHPVLEGSPAVQAILATFLKTADGQSADIVVQAATQLLALIVGNAHTRAAAQESLDFICRTLDERVSANYDEGGKRREIIPVRLR